LEARRWKKKPCKCAERVEVLTSHKKIPDADSGIIVGNEEDEKQAKQKPPQKTNVAVSTVSRHLKIDPKHGPPPADTQYLGAGSHQSEKHRTPKEKQIRKGKKEVGTPSSRGLGK